MTEKRVKLAAMIKNETKKDSGPSIWTDDELRRITTADDLHISPFRDDGKTLGTPTWIWSVVVDGGLFVRAYNGQSSSWFKAASHQIPGRFRSQARPKT